MLRSIPSLGHVTVLLSLILYVYAVIGINLFGKHDPEHWGSLRGELERLERMYRKHTLARPPATDSR